MATRFLTLDGKIAKDTRTGMPVAITTNIFTSVTYDVLKTMRDNGHLLSGEQYRIVDFVTTTTQENTQSAGHPFDIIVVADSANTLNENARAVAHAGDTYFANSKLSAWEIKYCFDNDKTRFWWADETNGKGVIYYMKDEYGNECPYDFKSIQFKRWATDDEIANDDKFYSGWWDTGNAFRWCYTFMANGTSNDTWADASTIKPYRLMNDYGYPFCIKNKIEPYVLQYNQDEDTNDNEGVQRLNNIVLYGEYEDNPTTEEGYNYNYVETSSRNTFGSNCQNITLGKLSFHNTFGDICEANTFGDNCSFNTFGDSCSFNTFGDNCFSNTFGDNCYSNTFGNRFIYNTFGNNCSSNTFGDNCEANTFGDSCVFNTFGDRCSNNMVDSGVDGAKPQPTTGTEAMQGVHIHYGVTGQFTVVRGAKYAQDVRTANDVTITV